MIKEKKIHFTVNIRTKYNDLNYYLDKGKERNQGNFGRGGKGGRSAKRLGLAAKYQVFPHLPPLDQEGPGGQNHEIPEKSCIAFLITIIFLLASVHVILVPIFFCLFCVRSNDILIVSRGTFS